MRFGTLIYFDKYSLQASEKVTKFELSRAKKFSFMISKILIIMHKIKLSNLLVIFLLQACVQFSVYGEVLKGKVVGVSDGDTITILDSANVQHKIRLTGIDAPEKAQAFGQASKKNLSDLIFNKQVEVLWVKHDRYQRILGKVVMNGQDICLEQVRHGMAWHYKKYQNEQSPQDRSKYSDAEKKARDAKLGLWIDDGPIEPAQFRHKK